MANSIVYNRIAGQNLHRVEAISDGVFAVAMTLLALDIKVPASVGIRTEKELFVSLGHLMPKFLTYFMSFMTLGIFWLGQSVQLSYLSRYDRNLNWMSLFFLMVVTLIPFSTAFLSEHIHFRLAVGLYWLNIFLLGLCLYVHWHYAERMDFISMEQESKRPLSRAIFRRIAIAQSLYAAGALTCFINTYLSIAIILLIQLHYALALFQDRKSIRKRII